MNSLPSLKLFSLLPLHSTTHYHHCHSYTPLLTNEAVNSIDVLFGHSNQYLVSRIASYDSKENANSASALVQCADWVQSLTGDRYLSLDNGSDSTTFEIDIPSKLSTISRAGDNSRLLLSIIHSAANNLLSGSEASGVFSVVLQPSNRKIFQALIAGQSPATKAIARTFLPAAMDSLDCSLVSTLLDTGINPNSCVDERRRRPLEIAIAKQSMEVMQLLLDRGADVNLPFVTDSYENPKTPLHAAVKAGRLDLVQLLLRAGARLNDPDARQWKSPLAFAAETGLLNLVKLLLDAGAEVDGPLGSGRTRTALQVAADDGNFGVAQLLLSYGADVNLPGEKHRGSALECAARSGNVDLTQLLLFYGAIDVVSALEGAGKCGHGHVISDIIQSGMRSHGIADNAFGRTALQVATRCCDFELVRALLDCGVTADAPPNDGDTTWYTALQIASHHGYIDLVELLLNYGADVNAPPPTAYGGATALQGAAGKNHMQLVQVLLKHGADVNAPATYTGRTALAEAAYQGNLEILQLLLKHGADMNTHGASVVINAVGHFPIELLHSLLDAWQLARGGNLDWTVDFDEQTALEIAAQCQDAKLIQLLLGYGAGDTSLALRKAADCSKIDLEVVELLLASGAVIGSLDEDCDWSLTALEIAAYAEDLDLLRFFLDHQVGATANDKTQALQVAAYCGDLGAVRLLLDHGANVNAAPLAHLFDTPRTAMQAAAGNSDVSMVRFLLEAGADVESESTSEDEQAHAYPEQGTALQFAAIAGSVSIVTLLIEKGANVFAPAMGDDGRTALEGAAEHGRLDIVQLLLNLGVEVTGSRAIQFAREEGHDGVVALLEEA
jgi:ankyrin repeat protein